MRATDLLLLALIAAVAAWLHGDMSGYATIGAVFILVPLWAIAYAGVKFSIRALIAAALFGRFIGR